MNNTMIRNSWLAGLLATLLLAPAVSRGQTLFSTFGPAETFQASVPGASVGTGVLGGFPVSDGGITVAVAFTPSVSANLSWIDLAMQYVYVADKATGPASLDVVVASDWGGFPGGTIETIQVTNALGSIPNAVGVVSANSVSQPFLLAGTQYWVVVAPPDLRNTSFFWLFNPVNLKITSTSKLDGPWPGYTTDEIAPAFAVFGMQNAGRQPALDAGGVVDAASFRPTISPGSWFSIFGTNLSPVTRTWQASDFIGGALPLSLNGVAVQIDGNPAAVSYVSPGQINAQVPDGVGPGTVNVQVITPSGPSGLGQVTAGQLAPSFFTYSSAGTSYVAATFADGTIVGRSGLLGSGVPSRPAKPGDVISLYGTGFGPTTPNVSAGALFSGAAPLAAAGQLAIVAGSAPVTVQFAGLSEAGLYQFNVIVPEVPDGDQLIAAQINGPATQQPVYLTIQH